MRVNYVWSVILVLCLSVSCGNGSSPASSTPAPPAPTQAAITVSVSPNPVIAQPSTDPNYDWEADWSVNFRETAGVGFNVDFINATLRNSTTGGDVGTLNFGAATIIRAAGTNHVNGLGSLSVPQGVVYTLAFGGRQGVVTIVAQCTDERGNVMNVSGQVAVTLREP